MQKQIAARTETIMNKLGFPDAVINKAEKDRVVVLLDAIKFPMVRKSLSRVYGHCTHNVPIQGGRRATWVLNGKVEGTIIAKSLNKNKVKLTFSTMPTIQL